MKRLTTFACLAVALTFAVGAFAAERNISSQPAMWFGETAAKASGDTVDLMGPGGLYPFRGDFETATARPGGQGFLTDGWTTVDATAPANNWHVDTVGLVAPLAGQFAWCGDIAFVSCGAGDPVGGYGNSWFDILEFRKTVGAAATVRVQADLVYDSEPGYDYVLLQRRTAANPAFEPITGGQGQSWDGVGTVAVDYTFTYTPAELHEGTDVAVAFVFDSDSAWSDSDCLWPTGGAARIDNITVTLNGTPYVENFEDGSLGPDWAATPNAGVGNFGRIWSLLGDADDCASNYSKLLAFIDDGLVVPGTGGTIGGPGNDYGPPGGYIVNNTGGLLGPTYHIECDTYSPVMAWPDPAKGGMSFAFDVYRHELLIPNDTPGIFYTWGIRTTAGGDINVAGWKNRNFVYYGGPNYLRTVNVVDDLVTTGATECQVTIGVVEMGWQFGYGDGTNGTPAPYFDNVRVKVYPTAGARIAVTEIRLANDGFPAIGDIDLVNLGANSIRFDMAANISARTHLRNDPGDSIWVDVTPRAGGTLTGNPVLHWTFAVQNTLFNPYRTLPSNPVVGNLTYTAAGALVANRYNFDLPDTGMIFPGDELHYYFAATDNVAGDIKTATAPGAVSLANFGNPEPMKYPSVYTVSGLPSIKDALGTQPTLLFWNDFGFRGGEDEWYGALRHLGLVRGDDYDVFDTHGPSSGVGNGLGGRATQSQIAGYTDMLYSAGDLSSPTVSNGDFNADPGNDLGLLNDWFALGGRDLFMTGDDLGNSLYASGTVARSFLEDKMGVTYNDPDVRDNIAGQTASLVVKTASNPVFSTANSWVAYGGCFGINDFDNVVPFGGATRLAQFTAPGGLTTPYPYAAAILNLFSTNKIVSMNHDLLFVTDPAKAPAPAPARVVLLSNVLDYFGVSNDLNNPVGTDLPVAKFGVESYPNPFNPQLTLKYTLKNPGNVVMKVYNVRGELVKTLLNGYVETPAPIVWDGTNEQGSSVSSGVYFVETRTGGEVNVQKATMVK
ncbi:MAG: T9SS type A sorting domain-containing protein [bacterium]|nr:T9SS type A sorting domain-containing protein [bacterium]